MRSDSKCGAPFNLQHQCTKVWKARHSITCSAMHKKKKNILLKEAKTICNDLWKLYLNFLKEGPEERHT